MDTKEAYRIVMNDILNNDISLFLGNYDSDHSSKKYMNGIYTVMSYLAHKTSEEQERDFDKIFFENLEKSENFKIIEPNDNSLVEKIKKIKALIEEVDSGEGSLNWNEFCELADGRKTRDLFHYSLPSIEFICPTDNTVYVEWD